jgi:hypothetical protein
MKRPCHSERSFAERNAVEESLILKQQEMSRLRSTWQKGQASC